MEKLSDSKVIKREEYGVEQVEGDFENFYLLLLDPILECYTFIFGTEGWEGLLSVSKPIERTEWLFQNKKGSNRVRPRCDSFKKNQNGGDV